ncbi:hypothetical protein D3C83_311640 [compost metagenome]
MRHQVVHAQRIEMPPAGQQPGTGRKAAPMRDQPGDLRVWLAVDRRSVIDRATDLRTALHVGKLGEEG